jgi:hypothetical protein
VIDRLVYDNLDPLIALAAAAARTERVEVATTVLSVGWRNNPVLVAKQLASVEQVSGGRLTAGLGLGGWPEDYAAVRAAGAPAGRGRRTRGLGGGRTAGAATGCHRAVLQPWRGRRRRGRRLHPHYYYGDDYFAAARADTLTTTGRLGAELAALRDAGATDVLLYPASSGPEQIGLLAEALRAAGFPPPGGRHPE